MAKFGITANYIGRGRVETALRTVATGENVLARIGDLLEVSPAIGVLVTATAQPFEPPDDARWQGLLEELRQAIADCEADPAPREWPASLTATVQ